MYNELTNYYKTLPYEEVKLINYAIINEVVSEFKFDLEVLEKHKEVELISEVIKEKTKILELCYPTLSRLDFSIVNERINLN